MKKLSTVIVIYDNKLQTAQYIKTKNNGKIKVKLANNNYRFVNPDQICLPGIPVGLSRHHGKLQFDFNNPTKKAGEHLSAQIR